MTAWIQQDYPFLPASSSAITMGEQSGIQAAVPSDGSQEVTIAFNTPFAQAPTFVGVTIDNATSPGAYALTAQVDNVTSQTFNVFVAGGPAGSQVSIRWEASP